MCGDLDEEDSLEDMLYARFRSHAAALGRRHGAPTGKAAAAGLESYLDKLFGDALARCVRDTDEAEESRRYELLAAQPLVFARLAGFLAGHLSLQEDPLRTNYAPPSGFRTAASCPKSLRKAAAPAPIRKCRRAPRTPPRPS